MFDNHINAIFSHAGFFDSDLEWIHPETIEKTHEIIYVTRGTVFLFEEGTEYELNKGDMIILQPNAIHKGSRMTQGVSFYWLHFTLPHKNIYPTTTISGFKSMSLLKEMLHYCHTPNCPDFVKNGVLSHILSEIYMCSFKNSTTSLCQNVFEWTRINISRDMSVKIISEHFGYNSEHLSRIIKKEFGVSLKCLIDKFLIQKAKEYLCNSNHSVKEISALLDFDSANAFVNFFKYHECISPNKYRNSYPNVYFNNK